MVQQLVLATVALPVQMVEVEVEVEHMVQATSLPYLWEVAVEVVHHR
jgi:hypothetical protein